MRTEQTVFHVINLQRWCLCMFTSQTHGIPRRWVPASGIMPLSLWHQSSPRFCSCLSLLGWPRHGNYSPTLTDRTCYSACNWMEWVQMQAGKKTSAMRSAVIQSHATPFTKNSSSYCLPDWTPEKKTVSFLPQTLLWDCNSICKFRLFCTWHFVPDIK